MLSLEKNFKNRASNNQPFLGGHACLGWDKKTKKMNENKWIRKDGGWERDGVFYPGVAPIKADTLLKSPDFRGVFRPGDMVYFCKNLIYKEEIAPEKYLYLASVKKVDGENTVCFPVPLGMLELSPEQKQEIKKFNKFPDSAFEKIHSLRHAIPEVGENFFINPDDFLIHANSEERRDYYR